MSSEPATVVSRYNAVAVSQYAAQVVLGVLHLTKVATPNSLIAAADPLVADTWSCCLILAAVLAITGALFPSDRLLNGLAWEAGGCVALAGLNGLYVVVLFRYTGGSGVVQPLVLLSVGVLGAVARARQCFRWRGRIERGLRAAQAAHDALDVHPPGVD